MKNLFKSAVFFCMISTLSIQAQGNEIANLYQQLISVFELFDSAIKTSTSGKIPSPPPVPTGKIPSPPPVPTGKIPSPKQTPIEKLTEDQMNEFFNCVKDIITFESLKSDQFKLSQDVAKAQKCVTRIDAIDSVVDALKQAQDVINNPQLSAVAKKRMKTALLLFSFALVRNFLNQFYINYQQNTVIYKGRYKADDEGLPMSENVPTEKLTVKDLEIFQKACSVLSTYASVQVVDFENLDNYPGLIQQVLNASKYLVNKVCREPVLMKKFEFWQGHVPVGAEHESPIEANIKIKLAQELRELKAAKSPSYQELLPRLVQLIYRTAKRQQGGIPHLDTRRLGQVGVEDWATNFSSTDPNVSSFIEQEKQKQKEFLKKLQEAPESKKREAFDRYAQVAVFKSEGDFKKAVEEYLEKLSPQQVKTAQQKEKEREQEEAKQMKAKEDRYKKLKKEVDAWLAMYKKGPGEYDFEKDEGSSEKEKIDNKAKKEEMYNKAKEVNELAADLDEQRYPANIILRLK